ncbi:hypothetical protein VP01_2912g1 [Puccinia sorghi]|uniref:Uncharacterized protein n=1 Tax=Puccinia sorghi TaxID=27349 RepID=A0A0L6V1A2_9BASI|nr:hypothetical protein VP01_2912g1 [Puccinia sorghi]
MDPKAYDYILKFRQESIPDLQAESNLHNSSNSKVLARYARALQMAECGVGRYITPHPPNNIVEHVSGTQTCYSQVCEIVELEVEGTQELTDQCWKMNVVHIFMPLAYLQLPAWSCGFIHPSYLLRPLSGLSTTQWPAPDDMNLNE